MKRAVLYLSESSDCLGLDEQEVRCRAVCEARGILVVSVYRDEGRGKAEGAKRPGLAAAMAEVRTLLTSGPALLVVYSATCIARTQRALWALINPRGEAPLLFLSVAEPFDTSTSLGRMVLGMIGAWSQLSTGGAEDAVPTPARSSGKRLGAPPMSELAPEAVRRVVELRGKGLSHRAIAEQLNAEGVKGSRGGKWWGKTIRAALAQAGVA